MIFFVIYAINDMDHDIVRETLEILLFLSVYFVSNDWTPYTH